MRVYSKYRNKYRVFGGFANLQRKDPCSVMRNILYLELVEIFILPGGLRAELMYFTRIIFVYLFLVVFILLMKWSLSRP